MPQINGRGIGILVVPLVVFGLAAVSVTSMQASMPAGTSALVMEGMAVAGNNLWLMTGLLTLALVGLVAWRNRGSASYGW